MMVQASEAVVLSDAQKTHPIPSLSGGTPEQRVIYWAQEYRNHSRLLNAELYTARSELFKALDELKGNVSAKARR